jgi:hypothetical protein
MPAGQQLEQQDAVARHARGEGGGVRDDLLARFGGEHLGQPEAQHLDLAFRRDLDVGGLQVAVHDALVVSGFQGGGDLDREAQRFRQLQRPAQDVAGHQLQH